MYHLWSSNALLSNALVPGIILLHEIYNSVNMSIWRSGCCPGWEVIHLFEVGSIKEALYSPLREVLNYQKVKQNKIIQYNKIKLNPALVPYCGRQLGSEQYPSLKTSLSQPVLKDTWLSKWQVLWIWKRLLNSVTARGLHNNADNIKPLHGKRRKQLEINHACVSQKDALEDTASESGPRIWSVIPFPTTRTYCVPNHPHDKWCRLGGKTNRPPLPPTSLLLVSSSVSDDNDNWLHRAAVRIKRANASGFLKRWCKS